MYCTEEASEQESLINQNTVPKPSVITQRHYRVCLASSSPHHHHCSSSSFPSSSPHSLFSFSLSRPPHLWNTSKKKELRALRITWLSDFQTSFGEKDSFFKWILKQNLNICNRFFFLNIAVLLQTRWRPEAQLKQPPALLCKPKTP